MTFVEKEEADRLFLRIKADHAAFLKGWTLHWCGDIRCQLDTQVIHAKDFGHRGMTLQSLLHTVAHALRNDNDHDVTFWLVFEQLLKRYLDEPLNNHQLSLRRDSLGSKWKFWFWKVLFRLRCRLRKHLLVKKSWLYCGRCGLHCDHWELEWSERVMWRDYD